MRKKKKTAEIACFCLALGVLISAFLPSWMLITLLAVIVVVGGVLSFICK